MKKRTKRLLAMLLASAMILQQGSTMGVLATESETMTEIVPETQMAAPETQVETAAPETKASETQTETSAPETKAPETQEETPAPETKASETSALETQASETQAPETQVPETKAPETQAVETQTSAPETQESEAPETQVTEKVTEQAAEIVTEQPSETETQTVTEEQTTEAEETQAATEEIAGTTETPAAAESETATEAAAEKVTESAPETETEAPKTDFTYEDARVKITATAQAEANLPQDAQIHADLMQPGTPEYQAAAAALEAAYAGQDVVLDYVFYDIYFTAESAGEGRIEPEAGTVAVSMQFKQPELTADEDVEVQSYDVMHVEDGKAQEVQSTVQTTEDGSIASVGFTSDSFSPFAVVMNGQKKAAVKEIAMPVSNELIAPIATGDPFEKLKDAKNVADESGMRVEKFTISKSGNGDVHAGDTGYSVELGVSYKGNLKDPKQVYYVELQGLQDYFDIDKTNIPTSAGGCKEILDGDSVVGHWFVDMENNRIYFVFDCTAVNALNPFVNLHFSANARVNSSGEKKKVEFEVGGQEFSFEWYPEKSEMSVKKTGDDYNEETGEVTFTVTVQSTKGTNTVKSLSDYYKHLSFQEGDTKVEVKNFKGEIVPSSTVVKDNNFVTTLDKEVKLAEGETLTFTYKMKIDKSKAVNGLNVAENTATLNFTDNWNEGESKGSQWTKEFKASRPDVGKTLDSYTPPTGGEDGNATWIITVKKGDAYLEAGPTIVDDSWNFGGVTLGDNEEFKTAKVIIKYSGADGEQTLERTIGDLGIEGEDEGGAVKINPNGMNFSIDFGKVATKLDIKNIESCEITYSTKVKMGDLKTGESKTVTNNVTVEEKGTQTDSDSKNIEVSNDNESGLAVTKTHDDNITEIDSGVKKVEWVSRLTIKKGAYKQLWFEDKVTANPNNVGGVYVDWFDISTIDSAAIDNNSIITSIDIPEDAKDLLNKENFDLAADAPLGGENRYGEEVRHGFKLTLLNSETEVKFEKDVTIEIHYVSYFDQKLASGSWLGNSTELKNTATFANEKGKVEAVDALTSGFVMGGVNKGTYGSDNEDGYINWMVTVKADVLKKLYFNETNSKWHWPDKIYFTDRLPENMELLTFDNGKGSPETKVGYNYGESATGNQWQSTAIEDFYVQDNGRNLTVDILNVLKTLYEGKPAEQIRDVIFVYRTQIVDYDQYLKDGKKAYSNEVTLHCGEKVTFSHSASAELTPGGKLSKTAANPDGGYVKFTISGFGTMIANLHKSNPTKYVEAKLVDVYGSALRYDAENFNAQYGGTSIPKDTDTSSAGIYYTVDDLTHQIEFHITNLDSVKDGDTITYSLKMIPTAHEEGSDSGYYKNTVWLYGYEEYKKETSASESTAGATGGSTAVYLSILKNGIYIDSEGEEKTETLQGIKFSLYNAELTSEGKLNIKDGDPLDTVSTLEGGRASFSYAVLVNTLYAITEDASTTPERYQAMEPKYVLFYYKGAEGEPDGMLLQQYEDLGVSVRYVNDRTGSIPITLELENREKSSLGSLTVTKAVTGTNAPDPEIAYEVKIGTEIDDADLRASTVVVEGGIEVTKEEKEIKFKIKNGESVKVFGLPVGTYTVTETTDGSEYTATYQVDEGDSETTSPSVTFTADELEKTVAITNAYGDKTGSLKVIKNVIGDNTDTTTTFHFKVTLKDGENAAAVNDTFDGVEFKNGVATFDLTPDSGKTASKTITGLPAGLNYTVEEVSKEGENTGYVLTGTTDATGTIVADSTKTAVFTNTRNKTTAELQVEKTYNATFPTAEAEQFSFTLTAGDNDVVITPKLDTPMPADSDGGSKTVKVTSQEAVSFGEITYVMDGTYNYTIAENSGSVHGVTYDSRVYHVRVKVETNRTGVKTATISVAKIDGSGTPEETDYRQQSGSTYVANFNNTYVADGSVELKVQKNFTGTFPEEEGKKFAFTLKAIRNTAAGSLDTPMPTAASGSTEMTVRVDDGTPVSFGTISYDAVGDYFYTISEVTTGDGVLSDVLYDENIYQIKVSVTEETETSSETSSKKAVVSYRMKDSDAWEKTDASTYTASFTNYEIQEAKAELKAKKIYAYSEWPTGENAFKFTLAGKNSFAKDGETAITTPMPENHFVTVSKEESEKSFGEITFPQDGTYNYQISEEKGSLTDEIKYDSAIYDVKITVTTNTDGTRNVKIERKKTDEADYKEVTGSTDAVFTAEFTNTHIDKVNATGSVEIIAKKSMKKDADKGLIPSFQFELDWAGEKGKAPTGQKLPMKVKADADGNVKFNLSFTMDDYEAAYPKTGVNAKEFKYTLTEIKGDAQGIIYDTAVYGVAVTIGKEIDKKTDTFPVSYTVDGSKKLEFVNDTTSVKVSKVDVADGKELAGAHIQILDSKGNVVEEWTSTTAPHEVKGLKTGETYTMRETVAPDGYAVTTDTTFTLKADGTVDAGKTTAHTKDGVLLVEDNLTSVKVSKVDVADGKELAGAHIQILDSKGNVVEEWTSTTTPHEVKGLKTGETYTMRETVAPDGYAVTTDTTFTLKADGIVDAGKTTTTVGEDGRLLVEDNLTSVKVSKVDVADGKELAGAHIQILDSKGNVVEEWTSTTTPHEVKGLKTGETYTMRETVAPEGYAVTTDKTFTLKADGTVDSGKTTTTVGEDGRLLVEDNLTSVKVSKVDVADGKELAGAHIQILDSKGNVVEEWTSTTMPHEVKGLKTGETYTMRETVAPHGYTVTTDTTFTLNADGTVDAGKTTAHSKDGALLVEDSLNAVSVQKVDETGATLKGAKLVVKNADGVAVESWTSDGTAHSISGIAKGKYTLSEVEAPEGYQVSADVAFEITGKEPAGTVIALTMTDKKVPESSKHSLTVTKHLRLDGITSDLGVREATYYVALFSDEARTQRVSNVKKIEFKNATTSSVVFNNLGAGTYYVGETDENGTLLVSKVVNDKLIFYPEYGDKAVATLSGKKSESGNAEFTNVYVELTSGFYLAGQLTVTKKLLIGGEEASSDDTYYARVFSDKAMTRPASDVLALSLGGNSTASVTVTDLPIGETLDSSAKYYVAETDEDGKPLDPDEITEFSISIDKSEVVLSSSNSQQEVVITNDFAAEEEEESESETEVNGEKTAPKTGDDTNYMLYLLMMAAAAGSFAAALGQKRRRNRTEQ